MLSTLLIDLRTPNLHLLNIIETDVLFPSKNPGNTNVLMNFKITPFATLSVSHISYTQILFIKSLAV